MIVVAGEGYGYRVIVWKPIIGLKETGPLFPLDHPECALKAAHAAEEACRDGSKCYSALVLKRAPDAPSTSKPTSRSRS